MNNHRLLVTLAIVGSPLLAGIVPVPALAVSHPESESFHVASSQPADQPPVPFAVAETTLGRANTSRVRIDGAVVMTFDEDSGVIARSVAERLNALHAQGELRLDRIRAQQRGDRWAVSVGSTDLISFNVRFARIQDSLPADLAQRYTDSLKDVLVRAEFVAARPANASVQPRRTPAGIASAKPAVAAKPELLLPTPITVAAKPELPLPTPITVAAKSEHPVPAPVMAATRSEHPVPDPAVVAVSSALSNVAPVQVALGTAVGRRVAPTLAIKPVSLTDLQGQDPAMARFEAPRSHESAASVEPRLLDRSSRNPDQRALMALVSRGGYSNRGSLVAVASWYGGWFHGRRAADGSRFNQDAFTAAHKTLPFGTVLKVTNLKTQKSALVKITDRGPYIPGRSLDLSRAAANYIGMLNAGVGQVRITVFKKPKPAKD